MKDVYAVTPEADQARRADSGQNTELPAGGNCSF